MASPTATQAEIEAVWKAAVDIIETFRVHADDTQAVGAGKIDVLEQALVGTFIPQPVADAAALFRARLSDVMDPAFVRLFLDPVIREWGLLIDEDSTDSQGGAFETPEQILEAMYDYFLEQSPVLTVESRNITFSDNSTPTYSAVNGSLIGAGKIQRVTVDENGYDLENCTIQKHHFRCIQDANTGADEEAERFLHIGRSRGRDNLRVVDGGSGPDGIEIISRNAGGGNGGSILSNSSFQTFNNSDNPKFENWDESFASGGVTADISSSTTVYRSFPGESSNGALSCEMTMNTNGASITLKQTVANMAVDQLSNDAPYYCRVMVRDGGSATGGTLTIKLGSIAATGTASLSVASLTTSWTELLVPLGTSCWLKNFNEDPLDLELAWTTGTSGVVLWDDVILAPMELIDGTYWMITQNQATPTRWLVDDLIVVDDTGTYGNGKLNYYLKHAYNRYLPSTTGTPRILDP